MGKKSLQVKFDGGTLKNLGQNVAGMVDPLGLRNMFSGGSPGPKLDPRAFDIKEQAKKYEELAAAERAANLAAGQQLTKQLQESAEGRGPSLAEAQLRAASNRNLAQTLAAAQSAGATPLSIRNMLQLRGEQARQVGEQAAQARIQEQQAARQALMQQVASQAGISRADIGQGFELGTAPAQMQKEYELARFGADVARRNAVRAQQAGIGSALLGTAGQVLGAWMGGPAGAAVGGSIGSSIGGSAGGGGGSYPSSMFKMSNASYAFGGIVDGEPVEKDGVENDVVGAKLSPGEMVVPASVVQEGSKSVEKFAKELLKRQQQQPSSMNGYASLVAMKNQLKQKSSDDKRQQLVGPGAMSSEEQRVLQNMRTQAALQQQQPVAGPGVMTDADKDALRKLFTDKLNGRK